MSIEFDPEETSPVLKQRLSCMLSYGQTPFKLVCEGSELSDDLSPLSESGVRPNSLITVEPCPLIGGFSLVANSLPSRVVGIHMVPSPTS